MAISLDRPNSVAASSRGVGEGVASEFLINPADMVAWQAIRIGGLGGTRQIV